MRKGKLEHLLTTGKIDGKISRGRQRIKIQDSIAAWLGGSTGDVCGCKISQKVEGHDRLRLQQTRQLMMMMMMMTSSPHYSQSKGFVERIIKTFKRILRRQRKVTWI